jgi:hypothetical protein
MIPGLGGRLIGAAFATDVLPTLPGVGSVDPSLERAIGQWNGSREASLGPASSARAIADVGVIPLLRLLGYEVSARHDLDDRCVAVVSAGSLVLPAVVTEWQASLDGAWRHAVHAAIASDARWCLCSNGSALRVVDTHRIWARQYVEFDLDAVAHVPDTLRVFWTLLRADALRGSTPFLDRAVDLSSQHGADVCRALADGVLEALSVMVEALAAHDAPRHRTSSAQLLEQSLTVLYRVLFLLFAEARGLVPVWHPIYRDRYTIDSIVSSLMAGRTYRGIWSALRAIGRMAHAGCQAGDLSVTAFNGRLFSPAYARSVEQRRVDDRTVGRALMAIGTTSVRGVRTRIRYRDLDVEQLGAVYEHVLDYEVDRREQRVALRRTRDARKASGTFYTPRTVTSYLVRRTLAPLVRDRTAAEILELRVLDPAMGSGAFLVAACRYLAEAAEAALVRDGEWHPDDITADERFQLRRDVAQRCVFGVDLNPMAVQLARLSLWLATLAGDRPLTFLDHHLAVGDSLVGASIADALSRPPRNPKSARLKALPLFDADLLNETLRSTAAARAALALERDDDVQVVRRKEATLAAMRGDRSPLMRWKAMLDTWCACWFFDTAAAPGPGVFHALSDAIFDRPCSLAPHVARQWRERTASLAAERRFFHWELEFPEVFFDARGNRLADAGFDAVLGNPPWDMVRGDSGLDFIRGHRRADARHLVDFVRGSGIYLADARAHVNRFQLFAERALQLARRGGRIGLVLPSGVVSDTGSAPLRAQLFDRADVDSIVGLDNRNGIFPIHRSVRFVLLTATAGGPTTAIACRFGVANPDRLTDLDNDSSPLILSRSFLSRVSGDDDLAVPELSQNIDLQILEKVTARHPWLSAADGWNARFGRELNATDDRESFVAATHDRWARRVLEGKHLSPFRVEIDRSALQLSDDACRTTRVPRRPRLAYRDIASATNRLTLIAAIVPPRAVTTHTLFCLKTPLPIERQLVLCALLNSFVANYLVRLRVTTHVTIAITSRLALPVVREDDARSLRLAALAARLSESAAPIDTMPEYSELQAVVAHLYQLSCEELAHVLSTFPLIPIAVRDAVLKAFLRG